MNSQPSNYRNEFDVHKNNSNSILPVNFKINLVAKEIMVFEIFSQREEKIN